MLFCTLCSFLIKSDASTPLCNPAHTRYNQLRWHFQVSHTDSSGPRTGRKHFMQSNPCKLSPTLMIFAVSSFFQVIPNKNFRPSSMAWQILTACTVQDSKLDLRFWRSGHFSNVVLYRLFSQQGAPAAVNHVFPSLTEKSSNLTMCCTDSLSTNFCWPEMPFSGSSENWSCTVTFDVSSVDWLSFLVNFLVDTSTAIFLINLECPVVEESWILMQENQYEG